jgi:hypothetical protein
MVFERILLKSLPKKLHKGIADERGSYSHCKIGRGKNIPEGPVLAFWREGTPVGF